MKLRTRSSGGHRGPGEDLAEPHLPASGQESGQGDHLTTQVTSGHLRCLPRSQKVPRYRHTRRNKGGEIAGVAPSQLREANGHGDIAPDPTLSLAGMRVKWR